MSPKFKRKQYWVSTRFQGKYVGLILALTFLTAAICSYVVYYTSMVAFGEKLASVYPQGRLVAAVNTINIRIFITVLVLAPVVAFIGIYFSHKIAGPIFRMERFMQDMAAGNLFSKLILRKGDELMKLSDGINRLSESMKTTILNERAAIGSLEAELGSLKGMVSSKHPDPDAINKAMRKVESEISELRKEVNRFKVESEKS